LLILHPLFGAVSFFIYINKKMKTQPIFDTRNSSVLFFNETVDPNAFNQASHPLLKNKLLTFAVLMWNIAYGVYLTVRSTLWYATASLSALYVFDILYTWLLVVVGLKFMGPDVERRFYINLGLIRDYWRQRLAYIRDFLIFNFRP